LEEYLDAYVAAAGIAFEKDAPLFRTTGRFTGISHRLAQPDAYRMIRRRRARSGSKRRSAITACGHGDHRLREKPGHAGTRPGHGEPFLSAHHQLYDRRDDELTLDEYEKVEI